MAHILLVEDDLPLQRTIATHLRQEGLAVSPVATGQEMTTLLQQEPFDLILLDLALPDADGLALTRRLRTESSVPLMVLTARRQREDRLTALQLGADDFLVKPCDLQELTLRIKNLLVRAGVEEAPREVARFGDWEFDLAAREVRHRSEERHFVLTPSEFRLLSLFVKKPFAIHSRASLLEAVTRSSDLNASRLVDVLVSHLRRKLEDNPQQPALILTVHGIGYKFAPPP